LDAEDDADTQDKYSKNQENKSNDWEYFDSFGEVGIELKIDVDTENIKLIEISVLSDYAAIDLIGTITKIKMSYPNIYVIFKLHQMEYSRMGDLVNVIEDVSKDAIDELYLEPKSLDDKQMHFVIDLLKINPKLKKLYIHDSITNFDKEYLKFKVARLLEN
jgi:hypothetical protein